MSHTKKSVLAALLLILALATACTTQPTLITESNPIPDIPDNWWASDFTPPEPSLDGVFAHAGDWRITGTYSLETDAAAGDLLLAPEGHPVVINGVKAPAGPRQVLALVRFQPEGPQSTLALSLASSVQLQFTADKSARTLTTTLLPSNPSGKVDDLDPSTQKLKLQTYNQFAPADPKEVASLLAPALSDKWIQVRAEVKKGSIAVWVDDQLIAQRSDPAIDPSLPLKLTLDPGAQVAQFQSGPLTQDTTAQAALIPGRTLPTAN